MSINQRALLGGAAAGLLAGVVMGFMIMTMMTSPDGPDTINKIAALYGFSSAGAGFVMHLIHSVLIGALFGVIWRMSAATFRSGLLWGLLYGFIWWILGPIVIMPLWLAGAWRFLGEAGGVTAALPSLPGHLVFGLLLGFFYALVLRKSGDQRTTEQTANASDQPTQERQNDGTPMN